MMMGSLELADMDDYQFPLPGFRFHPTDEELVGFYLRRKVENKAVGIELIKQIDIYKYSPWDLPHTSGGTREKEWYFFTKRGRKYKNSVRPNRVTGSGFWKATGIDKQIYSQSQSQSNHHQCVGLKKTLVYYRGSAGKGTKTEWMMNEFRLPSISNTDEAEIWTLCRIFKRNVSSRKFTPNWRENPATAKGSRTVLENMNFKTNNNLDQNAYDNEESRYINFSSSFISFDDEKKGKGKQWNQLMRNFSGSSTDQTVVEAEAEANSPVNVSPANSSSFSDFDEDANDLFGYEKWEELKSIMESDLDSYESLLKLS